MKFKLPLSIPPLVKPIGYGDKILLMGSCFTEHISGRLDALKFEVLQNPNGILFNPDSVAKSLKSYVAGGVYVGDDLFYLNELWGSWDHHTRFSHIDKEAALEGINASQRAASAFVREADWVMITLGSAFQYYHKERGEGVANNHRAPADWFEKRLLRINEIVEVLKEALEALFDINPKVKVLFTISPVRHARDGVVANNRSKARLIEAVHTLCDSYSECHYFPAYELVIDVLRDYRYYDADLVHPNYAATEGVWEEFVKACIAPEALPVMEQVKDIMIARGHRPRFPETQGHKKFMATYAEKVLGLMEAEPYLDLRAELAYFQGGTHP
jgi:hypothetical protein